MNKRKFLAAAALGAGALPVMEPARAASPARGGPVLLTITGAVARSNRGAFDPGVDLLMGKHKVTFDKAWAVDHRAIAGLRTVTIKPTLEDGKVRTLSGPLLADVLRLAGVTLSATTRLHMRAVDGYAPEVTGAEVDKYRFIVATQLEGKPLALGGVGPLWALYDADRIPEFAAKPVTDRFARCPWALYHIDVVQG